MGYAARICHQTHARVRLQLVDAPKEPGEWHSLLNKLQSDSPTVEVKANATTRSLILQSLNPEDLDLALHNFAETGVLDLLPKKQKAQSWDFPMRDLHEKTDRFIREVSGERLDFRSTLGYVMLGLGLRQSIAAKFLPAGLTLMMYAATFLDRPHADGGGEA